jgi:hypothetical protein
MVVVSRRRAVICRNVTHSPTVGGHVHRVEAPAEHPRGEPAGDDGTATVPPSWSQPPPLCPSPLQSTGRSGPGSRDRSRPVVLATAAADALQAGQALVGWPVVPLGSRKSPG